MEETLDYVIKKIEDTKLKQAGNTPYWYMVVENIFPEDYYEEMIANTPTGIKNYRPLSNMYNDRFKYELGYGENCNKPLATLSGLDSEKIEFWKNFQQTFVVNKKLANTFLSKYSKYIHKPSLGMVGTNCRLSKDIKGYSIGVHTDRRNKILSALFYTPNKTDENILEEWGTQILTTKDSNFPHTTEKHHAYNADGSHDYFDIYKWVECKPNSMFSWVVTQQSYHGVPPINIEGERDSIAFFIKATSNIANRILYGEEGF